MLKVRVQAKLHISRRLIKFLNVRPALIHWIITRHIEDQSILITGLVRMMVVLFWNNLV